MGAIRSKTCHKGHQFDAVDKNGQQRCKTCERERTRLSRAKKKEGSK